MKYKVLVSIICFGFFVQPCFAADSKELAISADHLAQNLQDLKYSIAQLEGSNKELATYNRDLKEHIEEAKSRVQSLNRKISILEKTMNVATSKAQEKTTSVNSFENQINEIKNQVQNLDQEIATQDSEINKRLALQQLILQKAVNPHIDRNDSKNKVASRDSGELLKEKAELGERLKLKKQNLEDLQKRLDDELVLSGDPSVSISRLSAQRDQLKKELLAFNQSQAQSDGKSLNESRLSKQLNFEITELSRRQSKFVDLLQMLKNQYDGNKEANKNLIEEKKLKDNIVALENDNKLLIGQVSDLRFQMVHLDKQRIQLEKPINSVKNN